MQNKKLLIVGPIFNSPSGPVGPGGLLYTKLKIKGYSVVKTSHFKNKILRMTHTVYSVLNYKKYDIILLQSYGLLAFIMEDLVSRIATLLKKPIVFTLHGGAFHEFYNRYPNWVNKVLSRANTITSPSLFLKDFFEKLGYDVVYIPNSIDTNIFKENRNTNKFSLLWVRAFEDIYNPQLAIYSFAKVLKNFSKATLTMVGPDKGELDKCKKLIQELKLQAKIKITGFIPNHELPNLFNSHHVYLNTTSYESFGVALIEAGSCGIPAVSTNVGEIPLIWNNEKNILLSEQTVEHFSQQIQRLLNDDNLYNTISINCKKNVKKYDWDVVYNSWKKLINKIK